MQEVLLSGIGMPTTMGELIWYGFGAFAGYFLWSIKAEITGMRDDLKAERGAREALALELAAFKSRCDERHKYDLLQSERN